MARMQVLAPSLTPRGGDGIRMVSGRNGKRGELSHSSNVIDACTCIHNSVDLRVTPPIVVGAWSMAILL